MGGGWGRSLHRVISALGAAVVPMANSFFLVLLVSICAPRPRTATQPRRVVLACAGTGCSYEFVIRAVACSSDFIILTQRVNSLSRRLLQRKLRAAFCSVFATTCINPHFLFCSDAAHDNISIKNMLRYCTWVRATRRLHHRRRLFRVGGPERVRHLPALLHDTLSGAAHGSRAWRPAVHTGHLAVCAPPSRPG